MLWQARRGLIAGRGALDAAIASSPPVFTYIGEGQTSGTNGTTDPWTQAAAPIGNPAYIATRRVVVIAIGATATRTITAATIDNITATIHANGGATNIACFSAPVPSHTTADIVLTFSSSQFGGTGLFVFTVDNSLLSSSTPVTAYNDVSAATSNTKTIATLQDGALLAAGTWNSGTSKSASFTASTAGIVGESMNFPDSYIVGHKNGVSAQGASSVTLGWTGPFDSTLALFAFR